nr:ankyrin repeat domain-containing protein 29 isoform X3 [Crassostrea gigas]
MAEERMPTALFFVTVTYTVVLFCDCRPLDGYAYPVYTTEVCPKNLTEWKERSSALNCNQTNAYMCVPNENITELLEFCYSGPQIRIVKGLCMFLYKRHSTLDAYECNHFTEGCPSSNYRSQDVHIYQSCVAIANGCFLADPICNRTTTMYYLINSTNNRTAERADWTWKVTFSGVTVVLFIAVCSISFRIFTNKLNESNENEGNKVLTENVVSSALISACEKGNDTMIKCLLDKGAKIDVFDKYGFSPLATACYEGHGRTVQLLLDNGADIKLCDEDGFSPLLVACEKGHDSIVQLLLENDADINLCTNYGDSPLFTACQKGHDSTVQLLLDNGAYINLCHGDGASPLFMACQEGHESIVQLLLNNGADINLCRKTGASPLFMACQEGHESIVQRLLNNGADINLSTTDERHPLSVAIDKGHERIVQILMGRLRQLIE